MRTNLEPVLQNLINRMPSSDRVLLATIRAGITRRWVRQKDIQREARVKAQYLCDVLHGRRKVSKRMAAVFRGIINDKIWPKVANA